MLLDLAAVDAEGASSEAAARALDEVQRSYHRLKDTLLRAGAAGRVPVGDLVDHLDRLSNVRRLAEQMERGAYLWDLGALASGGENAVPPGLPKRPTAPSPFGSHGGLLAGWTAFGPGYCLVPERHRTNLCRRAPGLWRSVPIHPALRCKGAGHSSHREGPCSA